LWSSLNGHAEVCLSYSLWAGGGLLYIVLPVIDDGLVDFDAGGVSYIVLPVIDDGLVDFDAGGVSWMLWDWSRFGCHPGQKRLGIWVDCILTLLVLSFTYLIPNVLWWKQGIYFLCWCILLFVYRVKIV
jgi:hypothetical protein